MDTFAICVQTPITRDAIRGHMHVAVGQVWSCLFRRFARSPGRACVIRRRQKKPCMAVALGTQFISYIVLGLIHV